MRRPSTTAANIAAILAFGPLLTGFGLFEKRDAEIARKTGGEYFHADAKRFGVEDVERALSGLKRTENEARVVREYDEIFELLLLPAFLLLVGEACMSERKRRRVPRPEVAA